MQALVLLAYGGHGGHGHGGGDGVTLVVAIIAAVAAIAAAVIALRGVNATNSASRAAADREYVLKQLNELYGPIFMRRRLSVRLWKQLPGGAAPEPGVTQWRLIDHIEEIKTESDSRRRSVVDEILKIDNELAELITGKAGLLETFPAPDSFAEFLEHATTLRLLWERGENGTGASYKPFPNHFDSDIDAAIGRLRAALKVKT